MKKRYKKFAMLACVFLVVATGGQVAKADPVIKSVAAGVVQAPWQSSAGRVAPAETEGSLQTQPTSQTSSVAQDSGEILPETAVTPEVVPESTTPVKGVSPLAAVNSTQYCADQKKTFTGTKTGLVFQQFHCTLDKPTPVFAFDLTTNTQGAALGTITDLGTYTFTCQKLMKTPNPVTIRSDGTQIKGNYWVNVAKDRQKSQVLPTPDEYHGWVPVSFVRQAVSDKPLAYGPGQNLPTCA